MRFWNTGLIGLLFGLSSFAHAQTQPQIGEGWTFVDGERPTYVHQGTLFKCPSTLTEGYLLTRTLTDNQVNEVACFYGRGTEGAASFHWAQGIGTVAEEIADRTNSFWAEVMPGVRPEARELEWVIGGEVTKVSASQVTTVVPETQKRVGLSLAIGTVADRRIKSNELWIGSGEASNRVAAAFFALQSDAITNRKTCLTYGLWPTRTRARLSPDPSESASTAAIILLAKTVVEAEQKPEQEPSPPICHSIFAGTNGAGAAFLTQRTGVQELRVVLSSQDEGDIVAALGTRPKDLKARVDRDSPYFLYGKQGKLLAIFRSYRALPSYQQLVGDMAAIASGQLNPIAVVSSDLDDGKIELNIDPEEVEAEKNKLRPGSD